MALVCLDAELMVILCEYDHDITCLYNIHSLQACETTCLKPESVWQGDRDKAAVSWSSYPRLVHRNAPHLKECWKWFNTRTAGSSHLVTWDCKVICEERLWNIIRHALRVCLLLLKCFGKGTPIKYVQHFPFLFNHIFCHCFLSSWESSPKITSSHNNYMKFPHTNSFNKHEHL